MPYRKDLKLKAEKSVDKNLTRVSALDSQGRKEKGRNQEKDVKSNNRTAKGRFVKGKSGNPQGRPRKKHIGAGSIVDSDPENNNRGKWNALSKGKPGPGRPKGSKNKISKSMLNTWKGRQSEFAEKAIQLALENNDIGALRLVIDKLVAKADSQPVEWQWRTDLESIEDIAVEQRALLLGVADGSLTLLAAKELGNQLTTFADTVRATLQSSVRERFELDQRLLAKARADPACSAAASEFISRLHSLDLPEAALEHPAIRAAEAVANG